jgi:hypothetical protein
VDASLIHSLTLLSIYIYYYTQSFRASRHHAHRELMSPIREKKYHEDTRAYVHARGKKKTGAWARRAWRCQPQPTVLLYCASGAP